MLQLQSIVEADDVREAIQGRESNKHNHTKPH